MNTRSNSIVVFLLVQLLLFSGNGLLLGQHSEPSPQSDLTVGFHNPPNEAKART